MKKILMITILIIAGLNCQGQEVITSIMPNCITVGIDTVGQDSINAICKERGHVKSDSYSSTLMYCEPYVIDTDSTSVMVYPACNWNTYNCMRCGKAFTEQEKEVRKVIWRRKK